METQELLKKIRHLEIKAKGLTRHIFSGEYHSAFKGRGMAFSEVRDYQAGDEVRTIDWNVTARYNSPYVKVFEEERELTVLLVIDLSGSSEFGSKDRSKRDLILELTAILCFSAISNNDKVGAILITDRVEKYIAPDKGKQHALIILREIIEIQKKGQGTDINEGLKFLRNTQKKRTITFVISDFVDEHNYLEGLKLTRKYHDTIAVRVDDPAESELPNAGIIQLYNAETSETTWINSSSKEVRESFEKKALERVQSFQYELRRSGIDYVELSTAKDIIPPMSNFFKRRS
jgi:uncharacterized protein (DUF58 family)